jgi:hypothetical protein
MDKGKKFIVAIDPDVSGSGFCRLRNGKIESLENCELWTIFDLLNSFKSTELDWVVLIEKSSKKNASWVGGGKGSARDVGRNQEIANQIIRFCKHHGIPYRQVEPKGFSNITHESFCSITKTNFKSTNPEKRVAGLFAYHAYRGLV